MKKLLTLNSAIRTRLINPALSNVSGGQIAPAPFPKLVWYYIEGSTPAWAIANAQAAGYDTQPLGR